jgi:hypothetical protein
VQVRSEPRLENHLNWSSTSPNWCGKASANRSGSPQPRVSYTRSSSLLLCPPDRYLGSVSRRLAPRGTRVRATPRAWRSAASSTFRLPWHFAFISSFTGTARWNKGCGFDEIETLSVRRASPYVRGGTSIPRTSLPREGHSAPGWLPESAGRRVAASALPWTDWPNRSRRVRSSRVSRRSQSISR